MTGDDSVVTAHIAGNLTEARIVRGLLAAHGIDARIEDEEGVTMLDGVVSGNRGVRLTVRGAEAAEAKAIIQEAHDRGGPPAEEEE